MTRNQWTEAEISYLRANYSKHSVQEIADHLGRSYGAVKVVASRLGIVSKARLGTASVRSNYFDAINTHEKAYVLGLLTADGNIRSDKDRLTLKLLESDSAAIELVRDQIAPAASLNRETAKSGSTLLIFSVQSSPLISGLVRCGVTPRKSLTVTWPEVLPRDLVNSYVCGYFDGDGNLGYPKGNPRWTVVSGSRRFLERMISEVESGTGITIGGPYTQRGQNVWSIVKTGKGARIIDQWIHRDVSGLPRKRIS